MSTGLCRLFRVIGQPRRLADVDGRELPLDAPWTRTRSPSRCAAIAALSWRATRGSPGALRPPGPRLAPPAAAGPRVAPWAFRHATRVDARPPSVESRAPRVDQAGRCVLASPLRLAIARYATSSSSEPRIAMIQVPISKN